MQNVFGWKSKGLKQGFGCFSQAWLTAQRAIQNNDQ